jgi:hypothetical protein
MRCVILLLQKLGQLGQAQLVLVSPHGLAPFAGGLLGV